MMMDEREGEKVEAMTTVLRFERLFVGMDNWLLSFVSLHSLFRSDGGLVKLLTLSKRKLLLRLLNRSPQHPAEATRRTASSSSSAAPLLC